MKTGEQEANRLLAKRFYEEITNRAEFDLLDEILDPDIAWHDPLLPNGRSARRRSLQRRPHYVPFFFS